MNVDGRAVHSASLSEALARFALERARGAKLIDVGCMQINHHWHAAHFSSLSEMFDPAHNVDYAASYLKELKAQEGNWTLAVARYNAGPDNPKSAEDLRLHGHRKHGRERLGTVDAERARILQMRNSALVRCGACVSTSGRVEPFGARQLVDAGRTRQIVASESRRSARGNVRKRAARSRIIHHDNVE